ncbi:MAG: hypothetical protein LBI42_00045 [Chitinispirillales bacterium]|jgi:hypothetical protein|nr:hypothetical protein [Chitinispirillales bacterium]
MLRNIFLITLSAFVIASAAGGNKNNPKEHGRDGSGIVEMVGTVSSHDENRHFFVLDNKDTIYYNDHTIFTPRDEKKMLLKTGSNVKVLCIIREGDKIAERIEKAPANNKRTSGEKGKDTTKNKAADDDKYSDDYKTEERDQDTAKGKSKSGTNDRENDKNSKKHEKGKDRGNNEGKDNNEKGKDRGAEPDSAPNPENDGRGEGW